MTAADAPPGMPPGPPAPDAPALPPPGVTPPSQRKPRLYTLDANDDYMAVVSVGPAQKTAKEANAEAITKLLDSLGPSLAPHVADLYAKYALEGPVADELQARLRKLSPVASQPEDDDNDLPPEAQAQIFALQQQLQQAGQAVADLQQQLAAKKYAVDASVAIAERANATRLQVAEQQGAVALAVAETRAASAEDVAKIGVDARLVEQQIDHAHDRLSAKTAAQTRERDAAQDASLKLATTVRTPDRKD